MSRIFKRSGGYRKLHSFNFATIIHLAVINFCKKFIPWQEDTLGKTVGQMVGAARSGRSNIAEGSERAGTSTETEIKLTDVARASLLEVQNDLETFLAERESIPWSVHNEKYKQVMAVKLDYFEHTNDLLHDYWIYLHQQRRKFDEWLINNDPVIVANALIILIQRAAAMLRRQLQVQEEGFMEEGGIRERMHKVRTEIKSAEEGAPACPECGKPMRRWCSDRGEFWGCSNFPQCRGLRRME